MTEAQAIEMIAILKGIGGSLAFIGFSMFWIMLSLCFGNWK